MNMGIYCNWKVKVSNDGFYLPTIHGKYLKEFMKYTSNLTLVSNISNESISESDMFISFNSVSLIQLGNFKNYINSLKYFSLIARSLKELVNNNDFIYTRTPEPFSWLLAVYKKVSKLDLTINYHFTSNPLELISRRKGLKNKILIFFFYPEYYTQCMAAYFNSCSTNGSSILPYIPMFLRNKAKVLIESTIDSYGHEEIRTTQANEILDDEIKLLVVSRLEDSKGLDDLLYVINELRSLPCKYSLTIVGDGSKAAFYKSLSSKLELNDIVRFCGFISHGEKLDTIYRQHQLLINPSHSETGPRVILEAMANEVLCLSSDVGYVKDVLSFDTRYADLIYPPMDKKALKIKLSNYLLEPKKYNELLKLGEYESRSYTLNNFVKEVLQINET